MVLYDWDKIKIEYQEGKALNAISKAHGCNRAAIRKHAENGGWQRPDPADVYKDKILSKATHEEMLEFNPAYKECHKERMRGRYYYNKYRKYCLRVNPQIKELKHQVQSLKWRLKNINTEKTSFLSSCVKTVASLKSSF